MNLQYRIDLFARMGGYILSNDPEWQQVKEDAGRKNGWFIPSFVELATRNIAELFLQQNILTA